MKDVRREVKVSEERCVRFVWTGEGEDGYVILGEKETFDEMDRRDLGRVKWV